MTALRSVLTLVALATPAVAAPKIETVIGAGGIALPGEARGGTFCEQSRRAVVWLDSGDVVAIDRKGVLTPLGSLGRPFGFGNRIVCDPVAVSSLCKQPFATRVWRGYVAARCGAKVAFGAVGVRRRG